MAYSSQNEKVKKISKKIAIFFKNKDRRSSHDHEKKIADGSCLASHCALMNPIPPASIMYKKSMPTLPSLCRDQGVVISISIVQWSIEMCHLLIYHIYIFLIYGRSNTFDKFFHLYLISFGNIIMPLFYLNGDIRFRTNITNRGIIYALRKALLDFKQEA